VGVEGPSGGSAGVTSASASEQAVSALLFGFGQATTEALASRLGVEGGAWSAPSTQAPDEAHARQA